MTSETKAAPRIAVILAGGGGTRLWPASRRRLPKQLLKLGGDESLLAAAARRARDLFGPGHTLVVTAADQEEQIRRELPELPHDALIVEPAPRNTAAAVGLGAAAVARRFGRDARMAVFPADPHIADEAAFARATTLALDHAGDAIVTIGLRPTTPETGFGYIRHLGATGLAAGAGLRAVPVDAFIEKPTRERAEAYLAAGNYLWNSGMFFLTAGRMLDEARRHLPELGAALDAMVAAADFDAEVHARYPRVPAISIDHGIMEKAAGLLVVPAAFGWNDVGSWTALEAIRATDANGNVIVGGATVHDSTGNIVVASEGGPFIGVVGVSDLVVVATRDAVLVVPKGRAQDVRLITEALKAAGRTELL